MRITELGETLRRLAPNQEFELPIETFFQLFGDARGAGAQALQDARRFAAEADCALVYDDFGQFNPVFRKKSK